MLGLQCGHGLSAVENAFLDAMTATARPASMRPRPLGRGERRCRGRPRRSPPGFNAATASRPWRTPLLLKRIHRGLVASMRPRPLGRGERHGAQGKGPGVEASMRPRPLSRGEPVRRRGPARKRKASMRPRPLGRGERRGDPANQHPLSWLQCGHGLSAVENLEVLETEKGGAELQCGHGLSAVENLKPLSRSRRSGRRFNAATASRPWRTQHAIAGGSAATRLQCGHGLSAVEN